MCQNSELDLYITGNIHTDIHSEQRKMTKLTPLQQAYNENSLLWQFFLLFFLLKNYKINHMEVFIILWDQSTDHGQISNRLVERRRRKSTQPASNWMGN